ncbi:DUF1877 family protein [Glycomyces salinus]|uniref:DUF1877 family protein n=1 Tax=Glycomyces salinus TaxID=980294 RepID=UPI0018EDD85E|nr:DUF1877 family protein [Glycomyces salinus]
MYIDFVKVTPAELERASDDPELAAALIGAEVDSEVDSGPSGEVGKAWAGIEYLLDEAGYGFEFLMEGDRIIDEDMYCVDGWWPGLVSEVAARLEDLPWERLSAHFDAAAMRAAKVYACGAEGDREFLEEYYVMMRAFFKDAAASGAAAIMEFSG